MKPLSERAVAGRLARQAAKQGYEISVEARDALLDDQRHRCVICERPFRVPQWHLRCTFEGKITGRRLTLPAQIDHDHTTGMVRGILCVFCNRHVLGIVEGHPEWVRRAQEYLKWR